MSEKSPRRQIQERLGWETRHVPYVGDEYFYTPTKEWTCIPWYETEIDDAWELIEKMAELKYVSVSCYLSHHVSPCCRVDAVLDCVRSDADIVRRNALEYAETMPEAICKAFLMATEKDS